MSQFYGVVEGQAKTRATRRGSRNSNLTTIAASWAGAVRTTLTEQDGQDWATVELIPWHGHGTNRLLYSGPCNGGNDEHPPK